jgi:catechol 2,3-dioxygenase-like lactoylglutathione lyase family enzyme
MKLISLKTKIITPRLSETRDWYRDLFGLPLLDEWDDPYDRGCILGVGGPDGQAFLEIYYAPTEAQFDGLSLQFRVEDIDSFGIPNDGRFPHRGPEDRPWGSRYLFFTDPNGISVIVFSGGSL